MASIPNIRELVQWLAFVVSQLLWDVCELFGGEQGMGHPPSYRTYIEVPARISEHFSSISLRPTRVPDN